MPVSNITNPKGAWQTVTSFITGVDDNGNAIQYPRTVDQFRANATITAKQAVQFVAATASVPLSVTPLAVAGATAAALFCGVALESAVAGELVNVVVRGPAIVNCGNGTPAEGSFAIKHAATDGALIASPTPDATTIAGTLVGVWLSAEIGTTDTGWVYVGIRG